MLCPGFIVLQSTFSHPVSPVEPYHGPLRLSNLFDCCSTLQRVPVCDPPARWTAPGAASLPEVDHRLAVRPPASGPERRRIINGELARQQQRVAGLQSLNSSVRANIEYDTRGARGQHKRLVTDEAAAKAGTTTADAWWEGKGEHGDESMHPAPRVVTAPVSDEDTALEMNPWNLYRGVNPDCGHSVQLRCVCEDATSHPVVSGPGEYSRRPAGAHFRLNLNMCVLILPIYLSPLPSLYVQVGHSPCPLRLLVQHQPLVL
jgi:hypothetical protein